MSTIKTCADLKSAIADWLGRDDLTNRIPDFISFAETRIHYGSSAGQMALQPLRLPVMLKTISTPEGDSDQQDIVLPGDAIAMASITYYAKFPALVKDTDSNWLLENAPDVYLFSALVEASIYTRDRAAADEYLIRYASACITLKRNDSAGEQPS